MAILYDAGSEYEWSITLEGDWFVSVIVLQGFQQCFLQQGFNFLETCIRVLIPYKAVLLFEECHIVVLCDDWGGGWMSAGNLLLLKMTVVPASFGGGGVISVMPWIFSGSGEYPLAENTPPKNVTESCLMEHLLLLKTSPSFWATLNKFMMLASWSLSSFPYMNTLSCMANTPGHCATVSSILIWKMSWLILSPNGTCRNLYLPRCVLNVMRSDSCLRQVHPKECFVAVHFGEFCCSCENMGYLLKGWCLVVLMDDGFIQVLWVEAYPQLAICLLGVCERADPWCGLSLFGDDSLMYHLSQLFLDLLLVLDGNFPSSVLYWKDCRVCLDVIFSWHVTYAVEAVREQCLKIPGTVDGCRSRFHVDGVESQSFWKWTTQGPIFHWLCHLCCLRIWNYLTHLINRDHVSRVESFDSFFKGLERSQLLGPILCGLERTYHFLTLWPWGLERSQMWSILPLLADGLVFCEGSWKESQIVHFWLWSCNDILRNGLKMTQIYFSASSVMVCHQSLVNGLERSCWSWYSHCFLWLKWTWIHSRITHEWDLTWHSLGVIQWSLFESWSLQHKIYGLEKTFLSSAEVLAWCSHGLSAFLSS